MSWSNALVLVGGVAAIGAIYWWFFLAGRSRSTRAAVHHGVQEIPIIVSGGYSPASVVVTAGRPVRLIFDRRETNPCSEEIVISAFGVKRFLPAHERTAVEFTPTTAGNYDFVCGMGMLHGRLIVEG